MNQLPKLRYVLSAGRTGTLYLERLLNKKLADVTAEHEPAQTRYLMMLANLRNDWGVGGPILKNLFRQGQLRRNHERGPNYIEINPFLCAMTDLLPVQGYALHVIHAVRDPADWARSISSFKASDRFRHLIDYLPFAKPYPSPRPPDWSTLDEYSRALWRWTWCNSRIAQLEGSCRSYAVIRYEDLFGQSTFKRADTLKLISETLALPGALEASGEEMKVRENAFQTENARYDRDAAERICGGLAREYGYHY